VEEAVGPLVARQRELEAQLERAESTVDAVKAARQASAVAAPAPAAPQGGGSSAASRLAALVPAMASIPVTVGPSLAPAPVASAAASSASPHPAGPRPSLPPAGTYGVTVMPSTRPTLDLSTVGDVDISGFDGGRRKRRVASAVVVLMLLIIAGVVTMTLLSHN
jgi:hypothetical protein